MTGKSLFEILLDAVVVQQKEVGRIRRIAKIGSEDEPKLAAELVKFNNLVNLFLNSFLDKVRVHITKGREWSDPNAILEVKASNGKKFRIRVDKIDPDIAEKVRFRMNEKIENLFALLDLLEAAPEELTVQVMAIQTWQPWQWAGLEVNGELFPLFFLHANLKARGITAYSFGSRYLRWSESSPLGNHKITMTGEQVVITNPHQIERAKDSLKHLINELQRELICETVEARWAEGDIRVGDRARRYSNAGFTLEDGEMADTETFITVMEVTETCVVVDMAVDHNSDSILYYKRDKREGVELTWEQLKRFSPTWYADAPYRDPYHRDQS